MLDIVATSLVVTVCFAFGMAWFRMWYSASTALMLVMLTLVCKFAVISVRYIIAVGGSSEVDLTSDTYRYLQYGLEASHSATKVASLLFGGDETDTVIAMSGIAFALLGDSRFAVYVAGSLFGLVAMWVVWGSVLQVAPTAPFKYAVLLCLFPSTLYWSSSFGKESMTLFGLAVGLYGSSLVWQRGSTKMVVLGAALVGAGAVLLLFVRMEIALLLGIAILSAVFVVQRSVKSEFAAVLSTGRLSVVLVVLPLVVMVLPLVLGWGGTGLANNLFGRFENTSIGSSQIAGDRPSGVLGLLVGIPVAMFRPFPWEAGVTGLASSLDSLLLMFGIFAALRLLRLARAGQLPLAFGRIAFCSVVVVVGLFAALAGYGNLGLLVRMRSMAVPFLLLLVILFILRQKVGQLGSERLGRRSDVGTGN